MISPSGYELSFIAVFPEHFFHEVSWFSCSGQYGSPQLFFAGHVAGGANQSHLSEKKMSRAPEVYSVLLSLHGYECEDCYRGYYIISTPGPDKKGGDTRRFKIE